MLVILPGALASAEEENNSEQTTISSNEQTCSGSEDDSPSCEAGEELPPCEDLVEGCKEWADAGECVANPRYMWIHCALSCGTCLPEK